MNQRLIISGLILGGTACLLLSLLAIISTLLSAG